jgi:hypothetical protein
MNPKTKKNSMESIIFHFQTTMLTIVTSVVVINVTNVTHAPM